MTYNHHFDRDLAGGGANCRFVEERSEVLPRRAGDSSRCRRCSKQQTKHDGSTLKHWCVRKD
jgi:hypothetical protein